MFSASAGVILVFATDLTLYVVGVAAVVAAAVPGSFRGVVALSDDLLLVLGPFFCLEIWPAFLGVVAAADVSTVSGRGCVVRSLSLCGGLSARYIIGSLFCGCAVLSLNCYELEPVVNRLKHSGRAKKQDQSRGYELTNVGCVILS